MQNAYGVSSTHAAPPARAWLIVILLVPAGLAAERFAFYGARAIFVLAFREKLPALRTILDVWSQVGMFSPLVGGAIAVGIGRRGAALLGGIAAAAGLAGLGLVSESPAVIGSLALLTLGSGVLYVSALALGMNAFRPWSASGIAAASALAFSGINVGAALAMWFMPIAVHSLGQGAFLGLAVLAFIAATGIATAAWLSPARATTQERPGGSAAVVAALLVLLVPFSFMGGALLELVAPRSASGETVEIALAANSFGELAALVAACALFILASLQRVRVSLVVMLAGGLAVAGLAAIGASTVPFTAVSSAGFAGLFGAGAALVDLLALALIANGIGTRFVPLVIGLWFTAGRLNTRIGLAWSDPRIACVLGGVGAIGVAILLVARKGWWAARLE